MGAIALDYMAMAGMRDKPKRKFVDFAAVPVGQWKMHDRLENWAKWARGRQRQSGVAASAMFALYRSSEARRGYGEEVSVPVDALDAQAVAKGVAALPDKHRRALHWNYLHPRSPAGAARELGVTLQGLADLVKNGRQMLINRGI